MKRKLFIGVVAMIVLASCNNQQKIENWEPVMFESIGAPFLKPPTHFTCFEGPYADWRMDNESVNFSFYTKKNAQVRKYVKQCIKGIEKYADKIYDVSKDFRNVGSLIAKNSLTLEKLQEYAVKKGVKPNPMRDYAHRVYYLCDVIYSKDGQYFMFVACYKYCGTQYLDAKCSVEVYPISHLSAL